MSFSVWPLVELRIEPTTFEGTHSGRRRYKISCITCKEELHSATTGASSLFNAHLREKHNMPKRGRATPAHICNDYGPTNCPGCAAESE